MSNANNNMQTQMSNTLHNAIMEAGGKDHPSMLAPGNYVQWKSRIKRYINTKPNHEPIYYCLKNPPYKFTWADKEVSFSEGSSVTTTETYMENYKNVSQDIRNQLNAEAEAVQIFLTGIDNDIYSTVDACPNACEIWKEIERLKQGESINVHDLETNLYWEFGNSHHGMFLLQLQPEWKRSQQAATRNRGKAIVNSPQPIYDEEPSMVDEDDEMSKDKEIDKLMALISLSGARYDNQRLGNVAGARETVGTTVVQKSGIQCYNCKEFWHVARECQKPKKAKDATYRREKMLLCKQEEAGIQLNAEQADWRDDTDDESEDQELEAHYMYMAQIQEVSLDAADSGPIFDAEPLQKINDLNQTISKMKNKLSAHQEAISIPSQAKEAQIKLYKTREDKKHDKVIALENKVKVLDNIVYKTGQLVQTINLLNSKCRTSFVKLEFLKKAQRANPRLYDIGCYNDNLALMLAPESDQVIHLEKESRYFSERSKPSHTPVNHGNSKDSFNKQTILLEKRMDESIPWDQKCKSSKEIFKIKRSVGMIFDGVERYRETIAKRTYFGHIDPFIQNTIEAIFCPEIRKINADLENFHVCLKEEMVSDLRYFNSLELEDLKSQLQDKGIVISKLKKLIEKLKGKFVDTKFEESSVIRQPNAFKSQRPSILGKPTIFSDSLKRKDFSKSKSVTKNNVSNDFSKPVTAQILPPNKKLILKNTNVLALGMYKLYTEPTQTRTSQPQLKSNPIEDRVLLNNSQGNKQEVEDHRRNVKLSKNKMSVTACHDNLNVKTVNVNFVCASCGKCVLNEKHDMCILKSVNGVNSRTKMPFAVPVKIVLFIVDYGCSKYMTGNIKLLINFVEKFLGTMKFRNDQIAPILGYGDLVQGAVTIKRVYYVEGLNHNLFSVGQFCDADLEVSFWKSTCYIRDLKGNDLLIGILHQTFIARTPEQNGVVERRNRTLVEAARTMLSAAKLPLFFWAEAIATSCLLKTVLLVGENLDKIKEKGDACIFVGYSTQSRAYRVFNKRTRVIVESIHVNFDELPQMASDHLSSSLVPPCQSTVLKHDSLSPGLQCQQNVPHIAETVTTSNELDLLFSPMFAELLNGSSQVMSKSSAVNTADAPNQLQ
nr:ribonuclease H-like domain-containing protein [Tanacetum cinerariifolium]